MQRTDTFKLRRTKEGRKEDAEEGSVLEFFSHFLSFSGKRNRKKIKEELL